MTDHTKSTGDVEAREEALKQAISAYNIGATNNAKNFRDPVAFHAAINYAIDAYLAKLTSTKAEPSRVADTRPDIFAVNVGNDGRVRIVDLCYTAFMRRANGKNDEDGGPCDWFTDTYPQIVKGIEAMAAEHRARITAIEAELTAQKAAHAKMLRDEAQKMDDECYSLNSGDLRRLADKIEGGV